MEIITYHRAKSPVVFGYNTHKKMLDKRLLEMVLYASALGQQAKESI